MIYFDITTLSQWGGHPTGIIRVERELFRSLEKHLGSRAIVPVIYHQPTRLFFKVREDIARLIVAGQGTLDMRLDIPSDLAQEISAAFDGPSSDLSCAAALRRAQDWADRHLQAAKESFQEDWITRPIVSEDRRQWWIPFLSAANEVLTIGERDVLFSAGLDWDHKDVRAIRSLKNIRKFKYISFVYDLVAVNVPQYVNPNIRDRLQLYFSDLAWLADAYLCSSKHVTEELKAFTKDLTEREPRIVNVDFGVSEARPASEHEIAETIRAHGLEGKSFLLYVSTIEPRKNHITAYLAWKRGIESGAINPAEHALVFVGMPGWLSTDLRDAIAADRSLKGSIRILSNLSDAEIDALYVRCLVNLFPSFSEGYGLAIVEGHARGKWAISSPNGSLSEVAGDCADFIDPDDILGWSSAMSSYLSDPKKLSSLDAKVRKRKLSSWAESAATIVSSGILNR